MSMLSTQCNELRDNALLFEGYNNGEISRMLREAADTIESLCDRLQEETLGSGECEKACHGNGYEDDGDFMCSKCNFMVHTDELFNYCPGCGAKVVKR